MKCWLVETETDYRDTRNVNPLLVYPNGRYGRRHPQPGNEQAAATTSPDANPAYASRLGARTSEKTLRRSALHLRDVDATRGGVFIVVAGGVPTKSF